MAQKVVIDIDVKSAEAEKQVEDLNKDLQQTEQDMTAIDDAGDKMTGGLVSGFKGALKSVKSFAKSLMTVNGLLKASLFGVIALAITSVATALTNSEEGQNKFAKWLNQITVVIGNVTDILGNFGNAILSVITLNFDEAAESIAKVTEGIKNFGEETRKEIAIAGELSDMRAKADKAERQLQVERAKADRTRADLLEKAIDKEKFSVEERIAFLEEAGRLEDEITNKEIQAAKLRLEATQLENSLSESTKEDLDEEARLKAELINLETAKLTKQKEVTSQTIALKAEEAAALKAIEDEATLAKEEQDVKDDEKKKLKEEQDAQLKILKDQIRDAEAISEEERRALEIEKTTEHYDNLINLATEQGLAIEGLSKAKAAAIAKYSEEESDQELKWSDITQKEKLNLAKDGLNNMATILGEESAAGKAAAIAAATISTYQSAQDSYKALAGIPIIGPVLGAAAAGAAIVSGMAQVKAISSTKLPSLAGKSAPSAGGGTPSAPSVPSPPAFNIVGASGTNQLAEAIGGQQQQPVKAFVVSNDVTTSQELDRNIVEGASI